MGLVEWASFWHVLSGSSSAFMSAMDLAVTDLDLRIDVLLRGGCLVGGGSSGGRRVLRCVLRFVERDPFVESSRLSFRSSSSSSSVMDLAAAVVLVLAQLQA